MFQVKQVFCEICCQISFFSVYEFYIQVKLVYKWKCTWLNCFQIESNLELCCVVGQEINSQTVDQRGWKRDLPAGHSSSPIGLGPLTRCSGVAPLLFTAPTRDLYQMWGTNYLLNLYRLDIFLCFDIFSIVICGRNKSDSGCSGLKTCGYLLWMQFQILHRHQGWSNHLPINCRKWHGWFN